MDELLQVVQVLATLAAALGGGVMYVGAQRDKLKAETVKVLAEASAAEALADKARTDISLTEVQIHALITASNLELRTRVDGVEKAYKQTLIELADRDEKIAKLTNELHANKAARDLEVVALRELLAEEKDIRQENAIQHEREFNDVKERLTRAEGLLEECLHREANRGLAEGGTP